MKKITLYLIIFTATIFLSSCLMYKGVKVEINLKEKKCVFIYQGLISTETNESGAVKDYDSLLEIVNDQSPAEGLTLVEKKLYRNKKELDGRLEFIYTELSSLGTMNFAFNSTNETLTYKLEPGEKYLKSNGKVEGDKIGWDINNNDILHMEITSAYNSKNKDSSIYGSLLPLWLKSKKRKTK